MPIVERFVTIWLNAPRDLVDEFAEAVRDLFPEAILTLPDWSGGCSASTIEARIHRQGAESEEAPKLINFLFEWNDRYPPFGISVSTTA